ncbi:unnamed protein product [Lota lota]
MVAVLLEEQHLEALTSGLLAVWLWTFSWLILAVAPIPESILTPAQPAGRAAVRLQREGMKTPLAVRPAARRSYCPSAAP